MITIRDERISGSVLILDGTGAIVDSDAPVFSMVSTPDTTEGLLDVFIREQFSPIVNPTYTIVDAVDGDRLSSAVVSGNPANYGALGDHLITVSYSDTVGNSGQSQYIIRVVDTVAPVVTLRDGQSTYTYNPLVSIFNDTGVRITESNQSYLSIIDTNIPTGINSGTGTREYRVTDSSGNVGTVTRTVVSTIPPASTPPILSISGANPLVVASSLSGGFTAPLAGAVDEYGRDLTAGTNGSLVVDTSGVDLAATVTGAYAVQTVTYTATDEWNNQTVGTLTLHVTPPDDNTGPTIDIVGTMPISLNVGDPWNDNDVFTHLTITATDSPDFKPVENPTVSVMTGTVNTSRDGVYYVRVIATDAAGNSSVRSITVQVGTGTAVITYGIGYNNWVINQAKGGMNRCAENIPFNRAVIDYCQMLGATSDVYNRAVIEAGNIIATGLSEPTSKEFNVCWDKVEYQLAQESGCTI